VANEPAADIINPMTGGHHLAKNALSLRQVLFCCVTGAAPITAMLFNTPVAVLGVGYAAPAAFLIATIVLTIFSVGYIEMARKVTAAGGFYSFVSHGLGQVLGMGTALLIVACYLIFSAAVTGVTTYFFVTTVDSWTGVSVPPAIVLAALVLIMVALTFFHVEFSARLLGFALIGEVVLLAVFVGAVMVAGGGPDGIPLKPLNPLEVFSDNNLALATGAAGIGLFAAFWSWVGFEMAPNYAEEAKEPKKVMAPAMYGSVIGLGVAYVLVTWMYVSGAGLQGAADLVNQQFSGEIASAYYVLTDEYFGSLLTYGFQLFVVTGSLACQIAFFNTSCRYLFSMGREGVLPAALGRTHPKHHSTHIAGVVAGVIVGLWVLGFAIYISGLPADSGIDLTLGSLTILGTWSPLLGVAGILAIQALVSVSVIVYFARIKEMHWLKTLIAPILGVISQAYAVYLLFKFRGDLSAAADVPFIQYMWLWPILIFAVGIVIALVIRTRNPERYAGIGRYLHEDIAS
jgi:amino acid transporter